MNFEFIYFFLSNVSGLTRSDNLYFFFFSGKYLIIFTISITIMSLLKLALTVVVFKKIWKKRKKKRKRVKLQQHPFIFWKLFKNVFIFWDSLSNFVALTSNYLPHKRNKLLSTLPSVELSISFINSFYFSKYKDNSKGIVKLDNVLLKFSKKKKTNSGLEF